MAETFKHLDRFDRIQRERRPFKKGRIRTKPLDEWPEEEFRAHFKMTKSAARDFVKIIESEIRWKSNRTVACDPMTQFLITLQILVTGNFQITDGRLFNVRQSHVAKTFARVVRAIARKRSQFIQFHQSTRAIKETIEKFYSIARFPKVIGAIDGTHIPWTANRVINRERFRNRKGFLSINVQAVVDADMKFMDVVARWPGSVHDARIYGMSKIASELENLEYEGYLLGDNGYPLRKRLMVPVKKAQSRAEKNFNLSLARTRNIIERSFGAWKKKFFYLSLAIRTKLETTQAAIIACAVLWNFLKSREDFLEETAESCESEEQPNNEFDDARDGFDLRSKLIESHFNL